MSKLISTLLALFFSTGCVTKSYDYEYISLEKISGIKVVSYGRPEISSVDSDSDMPIRYELVRANYILVLEVDRKSYWPSIYVSAKTLDGLDLTVEAVSTGECGGFDGLGIDYELDGLYALRYEWLPLFSRGCEVQKGKDYFNEQVIGFLVKNRNSLIAEERLPFVLNTNGTYYEIDGL